MGLRIGVFILLISSSLLSVQVSYAQDLLWRIKKDHWSQEDEKKYELFVRRIGQAKCASTSACLKGPANPYHNTDPPNAVFYADCAKLPYFLRAYFAWKNNLPFSYVSEIKPNGPTSDIRYTPEGNEPTARSSIFPTPTGHFPNGLVMIRKILSEVYSGMLRIPVNSDAPNNFPDFYSIKLSREAIRPGTVFYDPNGHIIVVYKIMADGNILYMETHPDNSLTRGVFGKRFSRGRPASGAGFKNWRPLYVIEGKQAPDGSYLSGRIVSDPLERLADFSLEQSYGTDPDPSNQWKKGKFIYRGNEFNFFDYVRHAMASGELRYFPLNEFAQKLRSLCMDLKDRVQAAQLAADAGLDKKPHPEFLPANIYGADGEWENFATPSRDTRTRAAIQETIDQVKDFLRLYTKQDPSILYDGKDLKSDLLRVFYKESKACVIIYKKSDGKMMSLTMVQILKRIQALSFDPYHCAERRWGAQDLHELESCPDDLAKTMWYSAEQWLRDRLERDPSLKTDYTLPEMLEKQAATTTPDLDIESTLMGQKP